MESNKRSNQPNKNKENGNFGKLCRDGENCKNPGCKFIHSKVANVQPGRPEKKNNTKTSSSGEKSGACKNGGNCKNPMCTLEHPGELPGAPRQCKFFINGSCNRGSSCAFSHGSKQRRSEKQTYDKHENSFKATANNHNNTISPEVKPYLEHIKKNVDSGFFEVSNVELWLKVWSMVASCSVRPEQMEALQQTYLGCALEETITPKAIYVLDVVKKTCQDLKDLKPSKKAVKVLGMVKDMLNTRLNDLFSLNTIADKAAVEARLEALKKLVVLMMSKDDLFDSASEVIEAAKSYKSALEKHVVVEDSKISAASDAPPTAEAWLGWRERPTVGWLMSEGWLPPPSIKPSYGSAKAYAEVLLRVWTMLTFYWGAGAVWPKCKCNPNQQRGGKPDDEVKICGQPLLKDVHRFCTQRIHRGKSLEICGQQACWGCPRHHHEFCCSTCLAKQQEVLAGPPGQHASTDLYDCVVRGEMFRYDGAVVYKLGGLQSRKPPKIAPNWKTSYRLQPAALVAVVKLGVSNAGLERSQTIQWGEIVNLGGKESKVPEHHFRERGELGIRLITGVDCSSLRSEAESPLEIGTPLCIIDLQVFVPEVFSVLSAFADPHFETHLNGIPFVRRLIGKESMPRTLSFRVFEIPDAIASAVMQSEIPVIRGFPREVKDALIRDICSLPPIRTVDGTQLEAFANAMRSFIHITLGPPGTGKSYVGVCLVLSLILVKKHAMRLKKVVGPVVALSYKNHALDEFLTDVLKFSPQHSLKNGKLIRAGAPENPNGELRQYTEKHTKKESKAQDKLRRVYAILRTAMKQERSWRELSYDLQSVALESMTSAVVQALALRLRLQMEVTDEAAIVARNALAAQVLQDSDDEDEDANDGELSDGDSDDSSRVLEARDIASEAALGFIHDLAAFARERITDRRLTTCVAEWLAATEHWDPTKVLDRRVLSVANNPGPMTYTRLCGLLKAWMAGNQPPPRCFIVAATAQRCLNHIIELASQCCELHRCDSARSLCLQPKELGLNFCGSHKCACGGCRGERISIGDFCDEHVCYGCVYSFSMRPKWTVLPRDGAHACKQHQCTSPVGGKCNRFQLLPYSTFCDEHACDQCVAVGAAPFKHRSSKSRFCEQHKCSVKDCASLRSEGKSYCHAHLCKVCKTAVVDMTTFMTSQSRLCKHHRCSFPSCKNQRCPNSEHCTDHSCTACIKAKAPRVELAVNRGTCVKHKLCTKMLPPKKKNGVAVPCDELCVEGKLFCGKHAEKPAPAPVRALMAGGVGAQCSGITKKGNRCKNTTPAGALEGEQWYCHDHVAQKAEAAVTKVSAEEESPALQHGENTGVPLAGDGKEVEAGQDGEEEKEDEEDEEAGDDGEGGDEDAGEEEDGEEEEEEEAARTEDFEAVDPIEWEARPPARLVQVPCGSKGCTVRMYLQADEAADWLCLVHAVYCLPAEHGAPLPPPPPGLPQVAARSKYLATAMTPAPVKAKQSRPPAPKGPSKKEAAPAVIVDDSYEVFMEDHDVEDQAGFGQVGLDELDSAAPVVAAEQGRVTKMSAETDAPADASSGNDEDAESEDSNYRRRKEIGALDDDSDDESADAYDEAPVRRIVRHIKPEEVEALLRDWNWSQTREERLQLAALLLDVMSDELERTRKAAEEQLRIARRDRATASADALKKALIIGATVVGASRRLAAIRAAEPFAIVVEEACEIMEPTLVSVLALKSVQKLELVGDHRQLPAFVQQCWYNVQFNVPGIQQSLFERLIDDKRHGFTVLDEQRRMQKSISDLTRDHYADLVEIKDHDKTASQSVGDAWTAVMQRCRDRSQLNDFFEHKKLWDPRFMSQHLIPGVLPRIYFWETPNNALSRPKAGLSACNLTEAMKVTFLTKYLLLCGVPANCISIITPYKGQKTLITDCLRKEKCIAPYRRDEVQLPGLFVSTVDRYQGDENDIVILSLVRPNGGNRFIQLQNRFIVAVSRARLGFYIVGSEAAVRDVQHWSDMLQQLRQVPISCPLAGGGAQKLCSVGPEFPICCPRHPQCGLCVKADAKITEGKESCFPEHSTWNSFCRARCSFELFCKHSCGHLCHSPVLRQHTTQAECTELVYNPCRRGHADVRIPCKEIDCEGHSSYERAREAHKCKQKLDYQRRGCVHRVEIFCHQVGADGTAALPECAVKVDDYIHPDCGHITTRPTCADRRRYAVLPPTCRVKVSYENPTCKCITNNLECHEAVKLQRNPKPCAYVLTKSRPRCKHPVQLPCHVLTAMNTSWKDAAQAAVNSAAATTISRGRFIGLPANATCVEHGNDYGPAECAVARDVPICRGRIDYRGKCGHVFKAMECNLAFDIGMGLRPEPACQEIVSFACPICNLEHRVPCCRAGAIRRWNLATNASNRVTLTTSFKIDDQYAGMFARDQKPPVELIELNCNRDITINRSCSASLTLHCKKISCRQFLDWMYGIAQLEPCGVIVERTLHCGHKCQVPCSAKEAMPEPFCKVRPGEEFVFPCGIHKKHPDTCHQLQQWRAKPDIECAAAVDYAMYRCGHPVQTSCSLKRQLQQVPKHDPRPRLPRAGEQLMVDASEVYCGPCSSKLPLCKQMVTLVKTCGHRLVNVPCHKAFDFAEANATIPACTDVLFTDHPVCSHPLKIECRLRSQLDQWHPWTAEEQRAWGAKRKKAEDNEHPLEVSERNDPKPRPAPSANLSKLSHCSEKVTFERLCGHTVDLDCSRAFNKDSGAPCAEPMPWQCEDCKYESELPCHLAVKYTAGNEVYQCRNIVSRQCVVCSVNDADVECFRKAAECKRAVTAMLPCSHEVTWVCGVDEDPRKQVAASTSGSNCKQCLLPLWDHVIRIADDEFEALKWKFVTKMMAKVRKAINDAGLEVTGDPELFFERYLRDHYVARSALLSHIRDLVTSSELTKDLFQPIPDFGDDLQEHYEVVYALLPKKQREKGSSAELEQLFFQPAERFSKYGRGFHAYPLTHANLSVTRKAEKFEGEFSLGVGLRFSFKTVNLEAPLVTGKNAAAAKKATAVVREQQARGFDGATFMTGDPQQRQQSVISWREGAMFPIGVFALKLNRVCVICMEAADAGAGIQCCNEHFVCFDCLEGFITAAEQPDAILSYVDRSNGMLVCADCKVPYQLHGMDCKERPQLFYKLQQLQTRFHIDIALKKERERLDKLHKEEMKRELAKSDFQRAVDRARKYIEEEIMNLRCPRPACRAVFNDFIGCCALTCSRINCHCGFCAWCLADCGGDAHAHLVNCPVGDGRVFAPLQDVMRTHARRQMNAIRAYVASLPADEQRAVQPMIEQHLKDLAGR